MNGDRRLLLRGGELVTGPDEPSTHADLLVVGDRIARIGADLAAPGAEVIDCDGRLVLPGFVDTHSHTDGVIFDSDVQEANLRQGVTTVVIGQDGVGFAPGDGRYAADYFATINGRHPTYRGGGIGALLDTYDRTVGMNVAALVPAGTTRNEVMGNTDRPAEARELRAMEEMVREGMAQGAVGLSTGLDYVPGLYASAAELTAMARPVAEVDGVHVSHMRHGYETAVPRGMAELAQIAQGSGVRTHVSHLHGPAAMIIPALDAFGDGLEVTFDAYPYRRGCTLMTMPLLPAALLGRGAEETLRVLRDPDQREQLLKRQRAEIAARPDMGAEWPTRMSFVETGSAQWAWATGMTVADAARQVGEDPLVFAVRVLVDGMLKSTAVMATPTQRSEDELARIFTDPRHRGGSDGIYIGGRPHPRGWGTFARFIARYTFARGDLTIAQAVGHLSTGSIEVMRLGARGRLRAGWHADLIVMDPATVTDRADYASPRLTATGIDDVIVSGVPVLREGRRTDANPGRGIRRSPVPAHPEP